MFTHVYLQFSSANLSKGANWSAHSLIGYTQETQRDIHGRHWHSVTMCTSECIDILGDCRKPGRRCSNIQRLILRRKLKSHESSSDLVPPEYMRKMLGPDAPQKNVGIRHTERAALAIAGGAGHRAFRQ
jgi:hypothetical protein